jgi:predicted aldo/keto reductase-like oxidoreductase
MEYGLCPDCMNKLNESSALMTRPSSIFKGNNVYLVCKQCNQVLLYNKDRDLIFDLKEYKDDQEILEEINQLLSEVDKHYEVVPSSCSGNCSNCQGCSEEVQYQRHTASKNKKEKLVQSEPEQKHYDEEVIQAALAHAYLAVNKNDPSQKRILEEENIGSVNIDEWIFYELVPVVVKAVTTYEIQRV